MGCKKPEFYEISFLILIYVLSSEAAQQDYVCVCDCVCTLCVCMCHGVGCHYTVLQYKPRVISADTRNPAFRSTSPNLVSVPGLGGRGPRPGWDEYQTSPGRSEGPFLPQGAQASGVRGSAHYSTDCYSTAALPSPTDPFRRGSGEGKKPGLRSNQQIKKHKEQGPAQQFL